MPNVADTIPMRIGVICPDSVMPCPDIQPGEQPHATVNCRFAVILYMATGKRGLPAPFNGDARTPPVEVQYIQAMAPEVERFMSILHRN